MPPTVARNRNTPTYTFGADPEVMVLDAANRPVQAIRILPQTKSEPLKSGRVDIFHDNVLAEFRMPPASSEKEAVANMGCALLELKRAIDPHRIGVVASHTFSRSQLTHPHARKVGCDIEYCAYTLQPVARPEKQFKSKGLRTCGGHVHIGCPALVEDPLKAIALTRMLDLTLGLASVAMDGDPTSRERRTLYGHAGRFRSPGHGCEYRTPGNFWLQSPQHVRAVYRLVGEAMRLTFDGTYEKLWTIDHQGLENGKYSDDNLGEAHVCVGYDLARVLEAINTSNREEAHNFLATLPLNLNNKCMMAYRDAVALSHPHHPQPAGAWSL